MDERSGQSYCPETTKKGNGGKNAAEWDNGRGTKTPQVQHFQLHLRIDDSLILWGEMNLEHF